MSALSVLSESIATATSVGIASGRLVDSREIMPPARILRMLGEIETQCHCHGRVPFAALLLSVELLNAL